MFSEQKDAITMFYVEADLITNEYLTHYIILFVFTFETNTSFQSQSQTYQSQLNRRKQILDNTESSLKSQISQLEDKLRRANESQMSQVTSQ